MSHLPNSAELTNVEKIDQIISMLDALGEGYRIPLLRAARNKELGLLLATYGEPIRSRYLKLPGPTVIVLHGDHPEDNGPASWPQARKLVDWAVSAVIHATGGQAEHYALVATMAPLHGRILLIETGFHHHPAWLELISKRRPRLPVLNIVPPPGHQHPAPSSPQEVH
ncbi:hypothetical protein [Roseomonas indoligenes]|uniref:Uncharacterized protein n=1 Tax=Roseomonas indoligenes TaxID=2820811 RepID=A0A940MW03_9PROT|nr:hypothetical protein [Pararoseomonas indoligenes]MBP0493056.1 hypothetical protein [Pararoseomonas indoligenes]